MSPRIALIASLVLLALGIRVALVEAQRPPPGGRRAPAQPLGTGFTYQGQLKSNGALVNGSCDLAFRLYDDASAGSQIGSPITQTIPITNGLFTTQLDFGANALNDDARWLEIRVSTTCPSSGSFTTLTPREPVTPAPYALTALKTAYKNLLVVAKSGGHYSTISDALASISDNSASNRYLIYVAPGTYTETVTMKPYVDIEGAGELTTKITQVGSPSVNPVTTGTVVGANNAELRFLMVENTGGNNTATAIFNSSASPRLTHITASASGASGQKIGVFNNCSSPTIQSSVISGGSDYGIENYCALSSPYTVTVNNSQIYGSFSTIGQTGMFTTRVAASQLAGGAVTGTLTCIYVYNANYAALNTSCQ